MSRFGSQYHVSRPTGRCAHTGDPMMPGTPCVATLVEQADDEGFERLDYSLAAWEQGIRPAGLFSYWRTTVPDPDRKEQPLVDDQVLLDLFERLAGDERPQRVAFRFVLGLILMRKRRLRQVGRATRGEVEIWLMQPKGADPTSPPMDVVRPALDDEDVRDLTEQLGEILNTELTS